MRILQITNGYPPTAVAGVEIYTATLSRALAQQHEVFVLTREGGTEHPDMTTFDEVVDGVKVRRLVNNFRGEPQFHDFYADTRIVELFRAYVAEVKPDIIHFQHCIGLSVGMLAAARELGIPYLLTLHDYWYLCWRVQLLDVHGELCEGPLKGLNCRRCAWWDTNASLTRNPLFKFSEPLVHALPSKQAEQAIRLFTDRVMRDPAHNSALLPPIERAWEIKRLLMDVPLCLTPSQFVRNLYSDYGLDPARIRAVPLGIDYAPWDTMPPRLPAPDGRLRIGFIGTLMAHKGAHVLMDAVMSLPQDRVSLGLYGGSDDLTSTYIRDLHAKAGPNVTFAGRYRNQDLPRILSEIDVIVVPSLWHETFSIVAREALLAGVPVIASDMGALPEVIRNEQNGFLVPHGDSQALAAVLRRLLATGVPPIDPVAVREQVWSVERHSAAIEAIYRELC